MANATLLGIQRCIIIPAYVGLPQNSKQQILMSVLSSLFGKKKKPFKASCAISKEPVEKGYGYLLSTADVISSKKFWDNIMIEPETMAYTISHFKENDSMATKMRGMIFEKHSSVEKPWIISDSIIHLFDVDKSKARQEAQQWWDAKGQYAPEDFKPVAETLGEDGFADVKTYAVMEAGRQRAMM